MENSLSFTVTVCNMKTRWHNLFNVTDVNHVMDKPQNKSTQDIILYFEISTTQKKIKEILLFNFSSAYSPEQF